MVAKSAPSVVGLSPNLAGSLDEQIQKLKLHVIERAYARAQQRANPAAEDPQLTGESVLVDVSLQDVSTAFEEAIGQKTVPVPQISFFDLFPPFTCLCFLLCVVFGTLGLYALKGGSSNTAPSATATGFLDVAKIFAGALVGSTTSNVMTAVRARKGSR